MIADQPGIFDLISQMFTRSIKIISELHLLAYRAQYIDHRGREIGIHLACRLLEARTAGVGRKPIAGSC